MQVRISVYLVLLIVFTFLALLGMAVDWQPSTVEALAVLAVAWALPLRAGR